MRRAVLTALALVLAGQGVAPAGAEAPGAYPDFTFKRIGVPEPGAQRRITVQIDPEEQARLLAAAPAIPAPSPEAAPREESPPMDPLDWYWQEVSPEIEAAPGRFARALAALDAAPAGQAIDAPRLQHLRDIAARHGADILRETVGTRVSPALVLAVIAVESSGRTDAVSHKGAEGLMQLIPATAARFAVEDSSDAGQNIRGGVAYLDWLIENFDNDVVLALAGYNAGENAVRRNGGVPPFAETRAYVPKVLAAWRVARGLCVTPPELPSDGCVFRTGQEG